jgi:hypothetical protein
MNAVGPGSGVKSQLTRGNSCCDRPVLPTSVAVERTTTQIAVGEWEMARFLVSGLHRPEDTAE